MGLNESTVNSEQLVKHALSTSTATSANTYGNQRAVLVPLGFCFPARAPRATGPSCTQEEAA